MGPPAPRGAHGHVVARGRFIANDSLDRLRTALAIAALYRTPAAPASPGLAWGLNGAPLPGMVCLAIRLFRHGSSEANSERGRREEPIQISPYLSFKGECEEAFRFYEQTLGGQLGAIFRYAGSPLASHAPPDWSDKVMHGSVTLGEQVLMGADIAPDQYEEPKGFSLSLQMKSTADAERIFRELARDGMVVMPLGKTFWAERFGVLVDRFGIPWQVNCDGADQSAEG